MPKPRLPRTKKLRALPFNKMLPNFLTLIALSAGLTAIRFGLQERWEAALVAIAVAAFFDGLDGRIARLLKGSSKFGAELDSLSDFLCFGIAPALLLYFWTMQDAGRFGWMVVMIFPICSSLRLARFNTALENPNLPAWSAQFFTGVPSPAGAGMVLLPMILSFEIGQDSFIRSPWVSGLFLIGVGAMLISKVPTFSFKRVKVPSRWVLPAMAFAGVSLAFAVSAFWLTLSIVLIVYMATFPISIARHRKLVATDAEEETPSPELQELMDSVDDGLDDGLDENGDKKA